MSREAKDGMFEMTFISFRVKRKPERKRARPMYAINIIAISDVIFIF